MSNKENVPAILKKLEKINYKKKIRVRYNRLTKGSYSIYFDISFKGIREYEFLKMYIHGKNETRREDNEKIGYAIALRDKKELELLQDQTGLHFGTWKTKANFVEYFKSEVDKKNDTGNTWSSSYVHLYNFTEGKIQFKAIDEKFCEGFKDYLLSKVSKNPASIYFSKFKTTLKIAIKEKIIHSNPAQDINIKMVESKREFLSLEEVKLLQNTSCKYEDVKNAFLFSCFTGLRLSDIWNLTFDNVADGFLNFTQKKTNGVERMKLHNEALTIIDVQKKIHYNLEHNIIFDLRNNTQVTNAIKKWVQKAGIKKHITFHCARHTFATMCLTYDVDIYTVSKLLGHRDIGSTQIYAKLIDKKKDEAIDKLPSLD